MSVCDCLGVCAGEQRGELVSPGPRSSPLTQLTGVRETTQHGESLLLSGLLSPTSQEEPQDQHEEDDGQEEHGGAED